MDLLDYRIHANYQGDTSYNSVTLLHHTQAASSRWVCLQRWLQQHGVGYGDFWDTRQERRRVVGVVRSTCCQLSIVVMSLHYCHYYKLMLMWMLSTLRWDCMTYLYIMVALLISPVPSLYHTINTIWWINKWAVDWKRNRFIFKSTALYYCGMWRWKKAMTWEHPGPAVKTWLILLFWVCLMVA